MNTDTNDNTVTLSDGRSFTLPDRDELISLLASLKGDIMDGFRAIDGPDDNTPGMCVAIGGFKDGSWSYQTGDNQYFLGSSRYTYWGVGYLYRDSKPEDVADDMLDEIVEGMASAV